MRGPSGLPRGAGGGGPVRGVRSRLARNSALCGKSAWRTRQRARAPRQWLRCLSTWPIRASCSARRLVSSAGSAVCSVSISRRDILRHRSVYFAHALRSDSAIEREQGSARDSHPDCSERDGLAAALPQGSLWGALQKPPREGGGQQGRSEGSESLLVPSTGVAPVPKFTEGPTTGAITRGTTTESSSVPWFCAAAA